MVTKNIENAFPDKPAAEQKKTVEAFYRYLADMLVETIWMFGVSERKIRQRFTVVNPELVNQYYSQNRSVIIVLAHYSSWEIVLAAQKPA